VRRLSDIIPLLRRRASDPVTANGSGAPGQAVTEASRDPGFPAAGLAKFLQAVGSQSTAELLDLGPVIGSNIAFLGERLGCKIHVEDLYADLDRHAQQEMLDQLPEFLKARLALSASSIDGILCWDVFDHLDAPAASVLAGELIRVMRPGGALLALFATVPTGEPAYTKFVIEEPGYVRCRPYPRAGARSRRVLQNGEIVRLFEGLHVSNSVLLKSHRREMLFTKRAPSDGEAVLSRHR
jgi:2-polyprenyl-3-methyl-5-hydroxy-6-metoxy-1,4-benzoquinol methylase